MHLPTQTEVRQDKIYNTIHLGSKKLKCNQCNAETCLWPVFPNSVAPKVAQCNTTLRLMAVIKFNKRQYIRIKSLNQIKSLLFFFLSLVFRFICHGLRTGATYVFKVRAVNAAGISAYSQESEPVEVKAAIGEYDGGRQVILTQEDRRHRIKEIFCRNIKMHSLVSISVVVVFFIVCIY